MLRPGTHLGNVHIWLWVRPFHPLNGNPHNDKTVLSITMASVSSNITLMIEFARHQVTIHASKTSSLELMVPLIFRGSLSQITRTLGDFNYVVAKKWCTCLIRITFTCTGLIVENTIQNAYQYEYFYTWKSWHCNGDKQNICADTLDSIDSLLCLIMRAGIGCNVYWFM